MARGNPGRSNFMAFLAWVMLTVHGKAVRYVSGSQAEAEPEFKGSAKAWADIVRVPWEKL